MERDGLAISVDVEQGSESPAAFLDVKAGYVYGSEEGWDGEGEGGAVLLWGGTD